jgi:hypothetical protein
MALGAQVRGRGKRDQLLVWRPVRPVTAQAIYAQVFVPHISGLLSDGVRGMLPPIVAIAAQIIDRRICHQQGNVGCMRGMACHAIPFRNGFMFRQGGFLSFDRVGVALAAYDDHGTVQQGRLR